jgi:hypothetical protein
LQERTVGFTASRVRAVVPPEVFVTDVRNVSLDACFIATKVQRQDSSNGWQLRRSFYTADQVRYILLRTPQHILLKGTQLKKAMVMKDTSTSDLFDQTVESTQASACCTANTYGGRQQNSSKTMGHTLR